MRERHLRAVPDWVCEAYGEAGLAHGFGCFFVLVEPCRSETACRMRLAAERQRIWMRMQELAETSKFWAELVAEVGSPDDLLRSPD